MSLFSAVELAPRDPILGMTEAFNADTNPAKVNLGVGVYFDEQGKLPILQCVLAAERRLAESPKPKGYLPIDGIAAYDRAVQELVFGARQPRRCATGASPRCRPGWHRRPEGRRRFPRSA